MQRVLISTTLAKPTIRKCTFLAVLAAVVWVQPFVRVYFRERALPPAGWDGQRGELELKDSVKRYCVLTPAWRPAFNDLDRLIQNTLKLAEDFAFVQMFAVLSNTKERSDFVKQFPESSRRVTFLTLDSLLYEGRWTDESIDSEAKLAKAIDAHSSPKTWHPRRVTQALKKLLGLETIQRRYGCEFAWVLDSESAPLRKFSFKVHFQEFEDNPRLLVTNMSDPQVKLKRNAARLTQASIQGLGFSDKFVTSLLSYRSTDFWMFSLSTIARMMRHVSTVHQKEFVHVFIRHPAGLPVYYGNFVQHRTNTEIVVYPDSLRRDGFEPRAEMKLHSEVSLDLFTCAGNGPWTDIQRLHILSGPLAWIRGWRFDHLPSGGCKNKNSSAQHIVQSSPSITWATSNFDDQVLVYSE